MEKLNCKSLMIGDWVLDTEFDRNRIDQIETVETERVWLKNGKTYQPIGSISPIPLTPEILEKNGFKRKNDNLCLIYEFKQSEECISVCVYFPKGYNTRYYKNWASVSSNENNIGHCVCEYVHELQHALKLCGIEKEIKL